MQLTGAGKLWATWPSSAAQRKKRNGMAEALRQATEAAANNIMEVPEFCRNPGKLHVGRDTVAAWDKQAEKMNWDSGWLTAKGWVLKEVTREGPDADGAGAL